MERTILERADLMLRFFKQQPEGWYYCTPEQVKLIKQFWSELHLHDEGYEYTFDEQFTKIRKEKL